MISSPKIPTDLLWGLSTFFVVLAMLYLISVFYFRNKITKESKKIREKKKELSPIISEFLFYDEHGDKIEKINYIGLKIEVRELIKNPFDRKVLTEILMDLRKDVSGHTRTELFNIYQDLGLHEDAFKKLKSWRWQIISKGIFELTQMHVEEAYKPITGFINDKRGTVRKQAEIAIVTLKNEGISFFMDHTKYRISEWQQLKLLDVVRNKDDYIPPPFRLWLTSKNNYVVLFALRLIKHFNQNDANASLITLVNHKSNPIKREAIHCIKEFYVSDALSMLKQVFWKNNTDIKMHILDTIAEIGGEDEIPFLESIQEGTDTFMVKNKAVRAINTIQPEAILPTKDIEEYEIRTVAKTSDTVKPTEDSERIEEKNEDVDSNTLQKELVADTHYSNYRDSNLAEEKNKLSSLSNKNLIPVSRAKSLENDDALENEKDLTQEEIAFLPIVIDSNEDEIEATNQDRKTPINQLSGNFEEVIPEREIIPFNDNFLPLVVDGIDINPLNIKVVYEEVSFEKITKIPPLKDLEVYFELVLPSIKSSKETIENSQLLDFSGLKPIEPKQGNKNENKVNSDESNEFLEWPFNFENQLGDLEEIQIEIEEALDISRDNQILKPNFHSNEIMETLALLENIEELGDAREIPLLKAMLDTETSSIVLERIGFLLEHFNTQEQGFSIESIQEKEYSVFEELIDKGDLDSKIFLLNEIAELGDSKELQLLQTLVLDENKEIKKKAKKVLQLLKNRLKLEAENEDNLITSNKPVSIEELIKKDNPDFFKLNFEPITEGYDSNPVNKDPKHSSTLFDHLCNMSTKLYNRKND
ncbi:HEAT repeat domain-containing protein [Maribacter sp. PR1]|uniref:HEAT repeat domain-containing protein n=1 Tax=Maribacter cobaltidurans TaxID=1178778 RepID=A0ABU7ISH5_9FLAO|nr:MULTISPECIES: HEAT repeat domain-containing protein [Maribacter]MDC6388535.1 HEAT repeat domain-containing protein [Maribacter sp. PR1]MEE1975924.1 HEAT repeat domain-containing protein [Maribacter cobaltidurans]